MMNKSLFATLALSTSLAALPVLAAPAPSHNGTATVNNTTAGAPSQRNPLLADNGDVRIGKLVGTDVYNDQDQKLGTVDDVLMGQSGQPDVVLRVNGNLVEVPWSKLQFGNAQQNSDNKLILPSVNQNALANQRHFQYRTNRNG